MTAGPLDGVLVADFSRVLSAPYLTMMLGDLGADVVKVERPGTGDDTRSWAPPTDRGDATYNLSVNRNKRSVVLDLGHESGRAAARELGVRADVLIENFRPGTMARWGLGEPSLRAVNPGLVNCSISGFGSGPGAALPGYDLLVQATGGLMSITGPGKGRPTKVGVALVDVLCGLHAGLGVLAALRHRDRTGAGQLVEVDLLSPLLSSMTNQSGAHTMTGAVPGILGNRHPSIAPYEIFPDEDRDELTVRGVPCGPVNNLAEAFELAEDLHLTPRVNLGGRDLVANPIRLRETPATYRLAPPGLGEHTQEVLGWLTTRASEAVR